MDKEKPDRSTSDRDPGAGSGRKDQTHHGVEQFTVTEDYQGQRIDNFLLSRTPGVPKSHVYRIIRTGQVRVNSGRIKVTYRLKTNDRIRIPPLFLTSEGTVRVPDQVIERLEKSVVMENDRFLVLNKPAGLAVHKGSGLHFGVIEAMRQSRNAEGSESQSGNQSQPLRLELVHRLDRGTSGCLIIGKGLRETRKLQDLFRENKVGKHYLALTNGAWGDNRTVTLPLAKNESSGGDRVVKVNPAGKSAVSHFQVKQQWSAATLMSVTIETGRTHQIRVHAASQGHAVVGDEKYGGAKESRDWRRLGLKRLYLHCESMVLQENQPVHINCDPDDEWFRDLAVLDDLPNSIGHPS